MTTFREKYWDPLKRRWAEADNYQRAALVSMIFGLGIVSTLAAIGGLLFQSWYLCLIAVPSLLGTILSGSTYIGVLFDKMRVAEKRGTFAGVALAVTLALAAPILALLAPVYSIASNIPFINSPIRWFAYVLFGMTEVNSLAGLGNRACATLKPDNPKAGRLTSERRLMRAGILVGAAAGATLFLKASAFLTGSSTMAAVIPGLSIIAGFPPAAAGIVGAIVVASICASAADYISKTWNYLKYCLQDQNTQTLKLQKDLAPCLKQKQKLQDQIDFRERIEQRKNEYKGASFGVLKGAVVSALIISFTFPFSLGLFAAVGVAAFIGVACMATLGSLYSKLGRCRDDRKENAKKIAAADAVQAATPSAEDHSPSARGPDQDPSHQLSCSTDSLSKSSGSADPTFGPTPAPPSLPPKLSLAGDFLGDALTTSRPAEEDKKQVDRSASLLAPQIGFFAPRASKATKNPTRDEVSAQNLVLAGKFRPQPTPTMNKIAPAAGNDSRPAAFARLATIAM